MKRNTWLTHPASLELVFHPRTDELWPMILKEKGWQYKLISTMIEYSYVGKSFSDANNTIFNPTGATGVVPAYHVWDWTINWNFMHRYRLSGAINNLANAKYFTRRINMYPGPGILPADGRTFILSFGLTL